MSTEPVASNQDAEQSSVTRDDEYEARVLLDLVRENTVLRHQVQILESVPDLIVAFDLNGHIFFASQSVLDFLGLSSPEEVQGRSFWDLITHESKVLIQRELNEALQVQKEECCKSAELAGGRSLMVYVVIKEQGQDEESHLVSLKGVVHASQHDEPTCFCSIQLTASAFQRVDSGTAISITDSE
jgi:PAS domain S-box-containing protein